MRPMMPGQPNPVTKMPSATTVTAARMWAGEVVSASPLMSGRSTRRMKIVTWNVNGIRARQDEVAAFAAREQPDVLCLQEIKALPDNIPQVCQLPGYWCYWHGTKGYSGVGLHVRKQLNFDRPTYVHPEFDNETRIAVVR